MFCGRMRRTAGSLDMLNGSSADARRSRGGCYRYVDDDGGKPGGASTVYSIMGRGRVGDWIYPRRRWVRVRVRVRVRLDNRLSSPQSRPRGAGAAQDQMDHLSVRPDSGWASLCVCVCVRDSGERKSSIENNVGCEGVMARQPSVVARPSWNPVPRNPRRDDPGLALL